MNRSQRRIKPYKISRGSFEERKLREDKRYETQKALLFILPIVMVAVLLVGLYFGYMGYKKQEEKIREIEHASEAAAAPDIDPMFLRTVNSAYPLTADYVPELVDSCGVKVSPDIKSSLEELISAAKNAGYDLTVTDGYISFEEQKEHYENAVKDYKKKNKVSVVKAEATVRKTIPREGESEFQTGLIVSLDSDGEEKFEKSSAYSWLIKNCTSYGFILRYPEKENAGGMGFSPHAFRYVGTDHAYYITAYDMSFDEYVAYLNAQ